MKAGKEMKHKNFPRGIQRKGRFTMVEAECNAELQEIV